MARKSHSIFYGCVFLATLTILSPVAGEKLHDDSVLAGTGQYALELFETRDDVAWIQRHAQALDQARSSGRNILVVITAPSWCGYCRQLEARVFSKDAVAQTLNNKFVPLQILDTNNDRKKFNFDGYPTMFVAIPLKGGRDSCTATISGCTLLMCGRNNIATPALK